MIETTLSLLLLLLSLSSVLLLLGKLFDYEKRDKSFLFYFVSAMIFVIEIAVQFTTDIETKTLCTELLVMLMIMGVPYLRFKPKKKMTFAWIGLMVGSLFDFIECVIASFISDDSWQNALIIYCALYAFASVVLVICSKLIKSRSVPDFPERIPPIIYIVIFVADYSAYYSMTLTSNMDSSPVFASTLHYLSAVLSAICIGFIVYRYFTLSNLKKEDERIHALELMRYEEMIQKNADVRAFRHDYKNNLFALETFIQSGRTQEAEAYIQEMTQSLNKTVSKYQTGNILADAILSDKSDKAGNFGIKVEFEGIIPSVGIGNRDLCAILSNALDNAIEACSDMSQCTIQISSVSKPGGFIIRISNPVKRAIPIKNGIVRTSKSDSQNHGFGISNIRKAAKNYNGYVDITCENLLFTIEVGLMINQ